MALILSGGQADYGGALLSTQTVLISQKPIFNNFLNISFFIYPLGSAWMCSISIGNWNWKSILMINPKVIIHQMLSEGFKITSWLDLFSLLFMGLCWKRKYL